MGHGDPNSLILNIATINQGIAEKHKHLQDKPIPKILIGLEAEKVVGIQHEFVEELLAQLKHFGICLSFQAGIPPHYDSIVSPKTGLCQTKSSDHGMGKSLICADFMFTRLDENRKPIGFHVTDWKNLKKNKELLQLKPNLLLRQYPQPIVQLKHSLKDILDKTKAKPFGDLSIVRFDKETNDLYFQYQEGCGPSEFRGEFIINLQEGVELELNRLKHYTRSWNKRSEIPMRDLERIRSKFGADAWHYLDYEFPIYYQESSDSDKKPLMVFSDDTGKPIAGDWHFFGSTFPIDLPPCAFETFKVKDNYAEQKKLFLATEQLFQFYKRKVNEKLFDIEQKLEKNNKLKQEIGKQEPVVRVAVKDQDNPKLSPAYKYLNGIEKILLETAHSGELFNQFTAQSQNITPFEFLQGILLNKSTTIYKLTFETGQRPDEEEYFNPNIQELLMFGARNRNPQALKIEGKILHFYNGMVILTEGEEQLIEFYLTSDFLKETRLNVHFSLPMAHWAKVLEKQAAYGQIDLANPENNMDYVNKKTAQCYMDYKAVLAMEQSRRRNPFFKLNDIKAKTLMRQLYDYQGIPPKLMEKLIEYHLKDNYLKENPLVEPEVGALNFKEYPWPMEKWGPVIEKQLELRQFDLSIPDVPKYMKKYYENFKNKKNSQDQDKDKLTEKSSLKEKGIEKESIEKEEIEQDLLFTDVKQSSLLDAIQNSEAAQNQNSQKKVVRNEDNEDEEINHQKVKRKK